MNPLNLSQPAPGAAHVAWRPAGLVYLAVLLAAMAIGLWPDWVYPRSEYRLEAAEAMRPVAAPLPALKTVAVGQVFFAMAIYPVMLLLRLEKRRPQRYWRDVCLETLGFTIAAVPFLLAAAYVSDATASDVIRASLVVLAAWPLSWAAGRWMAGPGRPAALVAMLVMLAGLPAMFYVAREFLALMPSDWMWDLAPATSAWKNAASRGAGILPQPLWPPVAWLAMAIASTVAFGRCGRHAEFDAKERTSNGVQEDR